MHIGERERQRMGGDFYASSEGECCSSDPCGIMIAMISVGAGQPSEFRNAFEWTCPAPHARMMWPSRLGIGIRCDAIREDAEKRSRGRFSSFSLDETHVPLRNQSLDLTL